MHRIRIFIHFHDLRFLRLVSFTQESRSHFDALKSFSSPESLTWCIIHNWSCSSLNSEALAARANSCTWIFRERRFHLWSPSLISIVCNGQFLASLAIVMDHNVRWYLQRKGCLLQPSLSLQAQSAARVPGTCGFRSTSVDNTRCDVGTRREARGRCQRAF